MYTIRVRHLNDSRTFFYLSDPFSSKWGGLRDSLAFFVRQKQGSYAPEDFGLNDFKYGSGSTGAPSFRISK